MKYNYKDFLSQAHNLTEQCKTLVEALSEGQQECIICSNPIYQRSALWNCRQCCQPFHLGCIKRWIRKLNTGKDTIIEEDDGQEDYEEEKIQHHQHDHDSDEYEDGREEQENQHQKAAK